MSLISSEEDKVVEEACVVDVKFTMPSLSWGFSGFDIRETADKITESSLVKRSFSSFSSEEEVLVKQTGNFCLLFSYVNALRSNRERKIFLQSEDVRDVSSVTSFLIQNVDEHRLKPTFPNGLMNEDIHRWLVHLRDDLKVVDRYEITNLNRLEKKNKREKKEAKRRRKEGLPAVVFPSKIRILLSRIFNPANRFSASYIVIGGNFGSDHKAAVLDNNYGVTGVGKHRKRCKNTSMVEQIRNLADASSGGYTSFGEPSNHAICVKTLPGRNPLLVDPGLKKVKEVTEKTFGEHFAGSLHVVYTIVLFEIVFTSSHA